MADYETEVTIAATPEEVFGYLTRPEAMVQWMGRHAVLEPEPNGRFEVDVNGVPVRGRFLEIDPPNRLVVSWGMEGNDEIGPGSTRVEFTLTAIDEGTQLRLVHSGLPHAQAQQHEVGWTHFLERLQIVAAGGDAGPDPWDPGEGS